MLKDNIKNLRITSGMSQRQLAELLCVSHKTISHWEKGYTEPPIAMLSKMKAVFVVSYDEIIDGIVE